MESGNENEGEYGKRLGPLNDIGNLLGLAGGVIINRPSKDMVGMDDSSDGGDRRAARSM